MDSYNPKDENTLDLSSSVYTLPLRFKLGNKVMVFVPKESRPGSRPDFISSTMNGGGSGHWVSAEVVMLHFRQDDWCPGFYCPYMVVIDGDIGQDGRREATPVREDSEATIRISEEEQQQTAPTVAGTGAFEGCLFHPVCPALSPNNFYVRDFTKGLLGGKKNDTELVPYSIGRYNERRSAMYTSDLFAGSSSSDDTWSTSAPSKTSSDSSSSVSSKVSSSSVNDRRDIHIGVDVMGPVNTPVHAVCDGTIHAVGYNPAALDYGHVIVTRHEANGITFWALSGHLSANSIAEKTIGDEVKGGECLGWFGDKHENGGWPPHVHFQLSLIEPPTHDMSGVVSTAQHQQALQDYPDPRWVMGPLFQGEGLFESVGGSC